MANVRIPAILALLLLSGCGLSHPTTVTAPHTARTASVTAASRAIPKNATRLKFASAWVTASPSWLRPNERSMLMLNVMGDATKPVSMISANWNCSGGQLDSYFTFGNGSNSWTAPSTPGLGMIGAWVTVRYIDGTSDTAYVNTSINVSQ